MQTIRRAADRGHFNHGWLNTWHTFSFADYYDPDHVGFRSLRVINDDRIAAGRGFGMHPHRDMEILTCVLEGQLQHRDSLGHGATIGPGELQRITAGTGIRHSEFNPSPTEAVHLYQVWMLPRQRGLTPSYEQKLFPRPDRQAGWQRVASADGRHGAMTIQQDVEVLLTELGSGVARSYDLAPGRSVWLQVMRGGLTANGLHLSAGDGLAASDEPRIELVGANSPVEVMLFDLA